MELINRPATRRRRHLKSALFSDADFLIKEAAHRLVDRLFDTKRSFSRIALLGAQHGLLSVSLQDAGLSVAPQVIVADHPGAFGPDEACCVVAEEDFLPLAPASCDLILSLFSLHTLNDIPGALIQINRALAPDGLFLGVMPGGHTLQGLREALLKAELNLYGGAGMRMLPSIDLQAAAGLLQRAGFALPVCDQDRLTLDYGDPLALLRDCAAMGQVPVLNEKPTNIFSRRLLMETMTTFATSNQRADGRYTDHLDLIFMSGWRPSATQQQPLKPGSARSKLQEALDPQSSFGSDPART